MSTGALRHVSTGALRSAAAWRHRLSRLRWFVRELTGEATYDRYVAHARSHDPNAPVMSRRAFERSRTDAREGDPREGFRCC